MILIFAINWSLENVIHKAFSWEKNNESDFIFHGTSEYSICINIFFLVAQFSPAYRASVGFSHGINSRAVDTYCS